MSKTTETRSVGRPKGSTRERILDAALDLFTDRGYDKTSLREIADSLGFTKAALYYHFERKEDILMALHLRLHELGRESLERVTSTPDMGTNVNAWAELLDRFVAEVLENRKLFLFHVRNFNALEVIAQHHDHSDHEDMEEQLSRLLADKRVPAAIRVRLACALGAVFGVLMRWTDAFNDLDADELGDLVRQSVQDLLRPAFAVERRNRRPGSAAAAGTAAVAAKRASRR